MAGTLTQAELLKIFPVTHLPGAVAHGRSRHHTRKAVGSAHGRGRSKSVSHASRLHARAPLDRLARVDPWKHVGQARGQG